MLNTILRFTIDHIPDFRPTLPRDPYYGTVQEFVWPYRNFTLATRVCRYWRTVAIHFASNWSTIQICGRPGRQDLDTAFSSKFATLCLGRAAASPLDIALYTKPTTRWWEENLLAQMHRFRIFAIDDVDLLPSLCHPAPLLQSLTIEPTWRSGGGRPPATIPLLFGGQAPSLRFLSIRYFVPWPANTFADLTHLCLQGDGTSPPYHFAQCIDFLGSTPKLQELVLAFVESIVPREEFERIVPLPDLRRLSFYNCSQPVIARTLAHITLSPHTAVAIRFQRHGGWRPDRDNDYFACLPEDVSRVLSPLALTRFCMVQDDSQASWVRFVGCAQACGRSPSAFDLSPGLQVGGAGPANVARFLRACAVEELWTGPVRTASRLTLASRHPTLRKDVWRVLFEALPALRRLVLGDCRRYDIADEGCLPALASGELCPRLAEVWVIGNWSVKALCQLASRREAEGKRLERVVFRRRPAMQMPDPRASSKMLDREYQQFWEQADDLETLSHMVGRVDFEEFDDFSVSLPDVCFENRHAYWGSWKTSSTI